MWYDKFITYEMNEKWNTQEQGKERNMDRMRAIRESRLWEERCCQPYHGDEPYIFLSFDHYELREGLSTLRILNEAGCHVWYNENLLTGRPWTGEICDALEGCSVFFEVNSEDNGFSLTKKLANAFAWEWEMKRVFVYLNSTVSQDKNSMPTFIHSSLTDPAYPDRCRLALESAGYFSCTREEREQTGHYDLILKYYQSKEDCDRAFGGLLPRHCNLRTHRSWGDGREYRLDDKDLYCAVRWGYKDFYLSKRSPDEDYKPRSYDREFDEMIRDLSGQVPWELEKRFAPESAFRPNLRFPAGYPYKDEFDYLSSDDD